MAKEKSAVQADQQDIYQTPAYRRSRGAYIMECTFEYFVSILVTEAFLARLLTSIGISDALIGVISSFVSLAFLCQLFSIFVVQHIRNVKRFAIIFHGLSRLFFMSLYLIPFLPFAYQYKEILVIVCVISAYFGNYFVASMLYKWCNSHVHPEHRAIFSASKEMISLITGIVVSLGAGYIIDRFDSLNNLEGGFIFCAVAIFIFSLCDLICLFLVKKDEPPKVKEPPVPFREVLKNTLGNRNFRNVVILSVMWNVAAYTTTGFLGTYKINPHELAFSVGAVQIINLVGNMGRFFVSRPFGRYSDRTSFARGMKLAMMFAALSFATLIFVTPSTRYLIVVQALLYRICLAGSNQNMMNITYSYVDSRYFVQATAIKNSISGLCGFGASLIGSRILAWVQARGNTVFGIPMYGQQLLGLLSCALTVCIILFLHFVIQKQTVLKQ